MSRIAAACAGALATGAALYGITAAQANHTYGDWRPVPASMVGDPCDTIDGGSPTIVTLGEHAMYHDTAGTRYVVTLNGRICSS